MASKGEGSRGGHIIGHYKSGAPKYGEAATKSTTSAHESSGKRLGLAAAKIGAGVALTVAGGYAAGGLIRKAALLGNLAHKAEQAGQASRKFRIGQRILHEADAAVKSGTAAVGAAIVGEGASETIKGTKYDKNNNRLKIGVAAASSAAILSRVGFYKNLLPGPANLSKVSKAVSMAIKKGPKPLEKPGKMIQKAFRFKKKF